MKKTLYTLDEIETLHRDGHLQEAKAAYLALLDKESENADAWHLLGILYAEENELDEAVNCLNKARKLNSNDPTISLHLANIFKAQHLYEEAITILIALAKSHPSFPAVYNNLGTLYFAQQKWALAIDAFQAALHLQANYIDAYYNLGLALQKMARFNEAEITYQSLIELAPQHVGGRFQLACLLMRKKEYEKAIELFLCLNKDYSFHLETKINLAACFLKNEQIDEAKKYYLEALTLAPDDEQVLFNLGVIAGQQGDLSLATQYYTAAIKTNPNYSDAQYNLGVIFLLKKDTRKAILQFEKTLHLQPQNDSAKHLLAMLNAGELSTSAPAYVRSLFDAYANHYDEHLLTSLRYQVPQLIYSIVTKAKPLPNAQWNILDLGCGTGLCGEYFKSSAYFLTGVDLSENMLEKARKKKIYDALIAQEISLFLQDKENEYDLIIAGDVLVYMGELDSLFVEITKALKPNGLFVFTVEAGEEKKYYLRTSGRFAHSLNYLKKMISENHLTIIDQQSVSLRTQEDKSQLGYLYLLKKQL